MFDSMDQAFSINLSLILPSPCCNSTPDKFLLWHELYLMVRFNGRSYVNRGAR